MDLVILLIPIKITFKKKTYRPLSCGGSKEPPPMSGETLIVGSTLLLGIFRCGADTKPLSCLFLLGIHAFPEESSIMLSCIDPKEANNSDASGSLSVASCEWLISILAWIDSKLQYPRRFYSLVKQQMSFLRTRTYYLIAKTFKRCFIVHYWSVLS